MAKSLVSCFFNSQCRYNPWASAYWGKWGQLTAGIMDEKLENENAQKTVFYVYVIFWEQSGQAGVENGAMLTTCLFRYTQYFRMHNFVVKFSSLQTAKGHWPLTKNCGRFWYNQLYVTLNCVAVTAREVYVTTRCPSVCLSVRLSVPAIDRCCIVRRVCCWAPGEQEISIDCCTAGAQLQSRAVPPRQPT